MKEEARQYIKDHKKELVERFADLDKFPPNEEPFTLFMAGSPGAGKTEFSKKMVQILAKGSDAFEPIYIVRIDADDIKEFIPHYNGENSDVVQSATILGVEKIYDFSIKKKQNILVDGTFANYDSSRKNIVTSIKKGRMIGIFYIYQDPVRAWELTLARGKKEGRYIPKDFFIDSLFNAKDNVNRIKEEFGNKVIVNLIEKDYADNIEKPRFNIDNIGNHLKIKYTRKSLEENLC